MGNCVRRELGVEFDDDTEIYEGESVMEERMTAIVKTSKIRGMLR